jgi:hypothetical protein
MSFYTVGMRDEIGALPGGDVLVAELDRIAAFSKTIDTSIAALGGGISDLQAAQGLTTGQTINTLPTDAIVAGVRWLTGPWLINADGNTAPANGAAIRALVTGNVNDFAPLGMDTAIVIELDATGNYTITGIRAAAVQRRFLVLVNRSGFTFTFTENDPASQPQNRFEFSALPGELLQLPSGAVMLLYYEVTAGRWHLAGIPMVPSANLPASLKPVGALAHGRQWFAFRAGTVPTGGTPVVYGIGGANPAPDGTVVDANTGTAYGYAKFTSTVYAGIRWSGTPQQAVRLDQSPILRMQVKTYSSLAGVTLWAGIGDGEPTTTLATINGVMFRYQAGVDAGWTAVVCDGGASVTTLPIGAIAINTDYTLQIRVSGSAVYLSTDGGITEVNITGHTPATSVMMNAWFIRAYSQIGGTVGILIADGMCEYGGVASGLY